VLTTTSLTVAAVGALSVAGTGMLTPAASPTSPAVSARVQPSAPTVQVDSTVMGASVQEGQTAAPADAATVAKRSGKDEPDLTKMTLDQLRVHSAKIQSEFVTSSLAYEDARSQAVQAEALSEEAASEAREALEVAETARRVVAGQLTESFMSEVALSPVTRALSGDTDSVAKIMEDSLRVEQVADASATAIRTFDTARAEAAAKAAQAQEAAQAATDTEAEAQAILDDIQKRAEAVAEAAGDLVDDDSPAMSSAEQEARNSAALAQWQAYQQKVSLALSAKGLAVPRAARLTDPKRLPKKFRSVVGANGSPVKGVAAVRYKGESVTVLPRETVKAVEFGFRQIGKPYVAKSSGPQTFDCTGLASAAWRGTYRISGDRPARLLTRTAAVSAKNAQVGDLVFFTAPGDGVQHVGLNLGGAFMLAADAATQQVGVQQFPNAVFAATRPVLTRQGAKIVKAPKSPANAATRCGGLDVVASDAIFGWPVDPDVFTFSSTFGEQGELWSSGRHTGLDFSAAAGTPVVAGAAGTVTVQSSSWAGPNHVVIDHGDGFQTAYAHMRSASVTTGDTVAAGQVIGEVGSEGNSTGPHLHFEVLIDGVKVDPMLFLPGGGDGPGWGGFANGMIPSEALCSLTGVSYHALRCDAAKAYDAMAVAYAKKFGTALCITDSYRSFAAQVTLYGQKPGLAAVPGTSNHGWALAVDLCGGIESFSSTQHAWMVTNAPKYGWVHPDWARQGGGREEPWHWEFGRIS
jgi:murein DD-endopeptidase MepM/ murein hydrolase activator NlpD